MTTLVTGASGFLGSHVARQLVARGEEVRVLMRTSSTNRAIGDLSLEYVTGDLRDAASLERALAGVKCVFHVAADYRLWARKSRDIYDSNVGGTKNLLEAAKRAGVERFIYTSTVATIAVDRPECPARRNDRTLQTLEMDGRARSAKRREGRFACRYSHAYHSRWTWRLEAHADGKNHPRFLERKNARLC
jgi:nucleoside-diphosphate-sugar epimerase